MMRQVCLLLLLRVKLVAVNKYAVWMMILVSLQQLKLVMFDVA